MNEIKAKLTILCQVIGCNNLAKKQHLGKFSYNKSIKTHIVLINICEHCILEEQEPEDKISC